MNKKLRINYIQTREDRIEFCKENRNDIELFERGYIV